MITSLKKFDCVLVGSGPAGFVFAASLLQKDPSLHIALIEKKSLKAIIEGNQKDHRTTTLSAYTCDILTSLGVWKDLEPHTVAIKEIFVTDQNKDSSGLTFDEKDIGKPFGYTINNTILRGILAKALKKIDNLTIFDDSHIDNIDRTISNIRISLNKKWRLQTSLLVGADGRFSQIRQHFKFNLDSKPYKQSALVSLVDHEKPHNGTAFEAFYPEGPIAFLPYKDTAGKESTSALVFCGEPHAILALQKSTNTFVLELLQSKVPPLFGKVKKVYNKQVFDLEIGKVKSVYQARVVLIGDAAQYIHPVAGQGLNLSVRDAKMLATHLANMAQLGLDLGSKTILAAYQKQRHIDIWSMIGLTHSLVRLFSLRNPIASCSRRMGFTIINNLPFAKNFLMNRAMGYKTSMRFPFKK